MSEANVRITSSGVDKLAQQFGQADRAMGKLGSTGKRVASGLTRDISGLTGRLGGLKSMLLGVGIAAKAKSVMEFNDRIGSLQAKAKLSTVEAKGLRDGLLKLGSAYGVTKDAAADAADVFQDFGGVLGEGKKDFDFLAKTAKGATAAMGDLAKVDAVFIQQGLKHDDRLKAMATLVAYADEATVSMKDTSRIYAEIAAIGAGQGFTGLKGVQQLGTVLQVAGVATGGKGEESRTAVKALLGDLTQNAAKIKSKLRVDVLDKNNNMRDLPTLMGEIAKATGGKAGGAKGVNKFFSRESQGVVTSWAKELQKNGGGLLGKLASVQAGAGQSTIDAAYEKKITGFSKETEQAARAMGRLDEIVQTHGSTLLGFVAANPGKVAGGAIGGLLAYKALGALASKLLSRGTGKGSAGGLPGGGFGGVQPVFVVNMPGASFGQAAGFGLGPQQGGASGAAAKAGKWAGRMGKAAGSLGALGSGLAAGSWLDSAVQEATGKSLSGRLADGLAMTLGNPYSTPGMGQSGATAGLDSQARSMAAAAASGATKFQSGSSKVAMTPDNVAAVLTAMGAKSGLTGEALAKAVADAMAKNPLTVVVQAKGGLERGDVQAGRGAKQ